MHIVFLTLQTAFSLWMLMDAIQRGRQQIWYVIILVPFGEVAYFFFIYLPESGLQKSLSKAFATPESLEEIEYQAKRTPSLQNRLKYAQALHDHGHYEKSIELIDEILEKNPKEKEAWFGLGHCYSSLGKRDKAIEAFEKLIEYDFSYRDYEGSLALVKEYWDSSQTNSAIELMEKIASKTHRMSHRAELAKYLIESDSKRDVRTMLNEIMIEYKNSPSYVKRAHRKTKKEVQQMIKSLY